ncbi:MAG: hypothetical protein H0W02_10230 [Ktedonobacteraceae bacterium]|nr:hypothetical protein [Ktedonobacteraceae bacterium]
MHQEGLAYALQAALVGYHVPETGEEVRDSDPGASLRTEGLDVAWVSRLEAAISMTVAQGWSLERFEQSLARANVDVASITPAALRPHIAAAFLQYDDQRHIGITPD